MEATALCSPLMRTVMLLLVAQADFSYSHNAAFPQLLPDRQQLFKYESLVVSCEGLEGLSGWRVMRRTRGLVHTCAPDWSSSTGPCTIKDLIPALDTGQYWCEMGRKTSNTVNITVTEGAVILDSPVHPVMEGEATTLSCRDKQASSNLTADFFKDGHLMERSSSNVSILSVSKSNEGVYKCSVSGAGESPESWLTVSAHPIIPPAGPRLLLPLCIGVSVLLVALLLLAGLLQCRKPPPTSRESPTSPSSHWSSSSPDTTVYEEVRAAVPIETRMLSSGNPGRRMALLKMVSPSDKDEPLPFMPTYYTLTLGKA